MITASLCFYHFSHISKYSLFSLSMFSLGTETILWYSPPLEILFDLSISWYHIPIQWWFMQDRPWTHSLWNLCQILSPCCFVSFLSSNSWQFASFLNTVMVTYPPLTESSTKVFWYFLNIFSSILQTILINNTGHCKLIITWRELSEGIRKENKRMV